mmetsp:Transcript_23389/g.35450  ORF Transcript_23389/g.35450 Transcript_23389/m.35450 type:complete len:82 (-) Transcript_23389:4494-4739(-)
MHVVMVPRLMTGRWRRHLQRGSDLVFKTSTGLWDEEEYFEPLLMFVCLPYRSHKPKLVKQKGLLDKYGGVLQSVQEISRAR